MKFELVKTRTGYLPPDDENKAKSKQVSTGEIVICEYADQRNIRFHRKFFQLVKICHENLPENLDGHFPTPEDLRYELIRRAGFYREFTDLRGNKQYVPESIAFDKMSQERFEKLYDAVLDLVCRILSVDKPEIMDQLAEF